MQVMQQFREAFQNLISLFPSDYDVRLDCLRANYYFFSQTCRRQTTRKLVIQNVLPCLQNLIYEAYQKAGKVYPQYITTTLIKQNNVFDSMSIYSKDVDFERDINIDQFTQILKKVKKYSDKLDSKRAIIQIKYVKKKNEEQIEIKMQKGLGLNLKYVSYLEENSLFNNLSSRLKKKFMVQSMDSLINLQELNVEHFDVTFRNFVFTANRYKVIDFDSAKLSYSKKQEYFDRNQSLSQNQRSLKYQKFTWITFFSKQEREQHSKNPIKFNEDNFGKYDVAMFGLMIARLLLNNAKIDRTKKTFIIRAIHQLQKAAYPGTLQYNKKNVQVLLHEFYDEKYFTLIHFVFKNMLVPSFAKRLKFDQMFKQWLKIVSKASDKSLKNKKLQILQMKSKDTSASTINGIIKCQIGKNPQQVNNSQKQKLLNQVYQSRQSILNLSTNSSQKNKEMKEPQQLIKVEEISNMPDVTTFIQNNQNRKNNNKQSSEEMNYAYNTQSEVVKNNLSISQLNRGSEFVKQQKTQNGNINCKNIEQQVELKKKQEEKHLKKQRKFHQEELIVKNKIRCQSRRVNNFRPTLKQILKQKQEIQIILSSLGK